MKDLTPQANRLRKKLVSDKLTYVESVVKSDRMSLEEVLAYRSGDGNVLRVFIDSARQMPIRAASLIVSAARTAQFIPVEQVQVIHSIASGVRVNKINPIESRPQFRKLADFSIAMLRKHMPDVAEKTVFVEDLTPEHIDTVKHLARRSIDASLELQRKLAERGRRHGGDPAAFVAARFAGIDTCFLHAHPIDSGDLVVTPKRIVAVGPEQERLVHAARQGVRSYFSEDILVPSVQILTKHVISPFSIGEGGEPLFDDPTPFSDINYSVNSYQVERDLRHFEDVLRQGE